LGDTTRQHLAQAAFAGCATDPAQTRQLTGRGLCHGTGGLLATARRVAADGHATAPLELIEHLHQTTAGHDEPRGLLDGTAGADLATLGTTVTGWDACLVLT